MLITIIILLTLLLGGLAALFIFAPGRVVAWAQAAERGKSGLRESSVQVEGFEIRYLDNGAHGEVLVLLHGFSAEKDVWVRMAAQMPKGYRMVIPDLPGFGQSSRLPDRSYTAENQAQWLQQFAAALGLTSFHLAGNSMGGQIAAVYAHNYPQRVKSLGLFCSAGVDAPNKSELFQALENGNNLLLVDSVEDFDRVFKFGFHKPPAVPGPIKRYLARQAFANRTFNEKIFHDLVPDLDKPMLIDALLPAIQAPTLILWGDQDRLLDVSSVDVFSRLLPNSESVVMSDMGHMPMLERPAEAAQIYHVFLQRHAALGADAGGDEGIR